MKRTGGTAVVQALEDEGIRHTFGIPGTHNIELYDALADSERIHPILVTDEQAASFMADGVWRASGRLGCVNVVPGAGLTHALSGIAEAYLDTVPMLVLGCGIRRDTDRSYQLHDVDQLAMAAPVTKAQLRADEGEDVYATVRRACRLARQGRPGPVIVEIPAEHYLFRHRVADDEATGFAAPSGRFRPSVAGGADPPAPDGDALGRAADVLAEAERPLLHVGVGAAGAADRLVELAERLEAPVSTTFQGKGVFPETHPLWLWPGFGRTAPDFAREVADGCDATLAVGCRFSEVGTGSWSFEPPGPLVHVDVDPEVFDANFPAEVAVHADARLLVEALLDRLGPDGPGPDGGLRQRIRDGHEGVREEQMADVGGEGVTPAHLLRELQRSFGPEAVYTTDSGNGTFLALESLRLDRPGAFLAPVDYSCMGYSVPAAVGAKLARPDRPVVALAGDGAFLMTGLEILTAAREEAAIAVLVLRDRELAQISQFQDTAFGRRSASEVADYDLAGLCRGAGVPCLSLDADDEVEATLERLSDRLEEGGPVAVDVAIDYSRKTWFTRGVVRTTLGRLPLGDQARFVGRALWRRLTE